MKQALILLLFFLSSTKAFLQVVTYPNDNSEKYVGELRDGKKNGFGKITYINGSTYEGEWKGDFMDGKGILIDVDGTKYEGKWEKGSMIGTATIINTNGVKYIGEVSGNGVKEGKGVLTDVDGTTFEGEWQNGSLVGIVIVISPNGLKYKGAVSGDRVKNGKGIMYDIDGAVFEGEWQNNNMVGIATITSPNGEKYKGEVLGNGVKNGEGILNLKDGSSFTGVFYEGKYKYGVLVDKSKKGKIYSYTGEFRNNQIYSGVVKKELINCSSCKPELIEYKEGKEVLKENNVQDYKKPAKKKKKGHSSMSNRFSFGIAISGGFGFASIKGGDSDILDSLGLGYSPSVFLNMKISNSTSVELSFFYVKKGFEFFNYGDNYEYAYSMPLSYNTEEAKLNFEELGVSARFFYHSFFIGGYYSKLMNVTRSGHIFCTDQTGSVYINNSNYKYNLMDEQSFPIISGQRPVNEYAYGISIGFESREEGYTFGIGYDLNLSNYINNNYPLWDEMPNIDFYDTKSINMRMGYLYIKIGYVF